MIRMTFDSQRWQVQFFLLMLSVFTVFVGYGIALPVMPFLLENRFGGQGGFSVAWHTGMMTGVFMFTLFAFAPLWGKLSDRIGRRPVILIGLGGCVAALMAFGLVEELWLAYLTRGLGGISANLFSSTQSTLLTVTFSFVDSLPMTGISNSNLIAYFPMKLVAQ